MIVSGVKEVTLILALFQLPLIVKVVIVIVVIIFIISYFVVVFIAYNVFSLCCIDEIIAEFLTWYKVYFKRTVTYIPTKMKKSGAALLWSPVRNCQYLGNGT